MKKKSTLLALLSLSLTAATLLGGGSVKAETNFANPFQNAEKRLNIPAPETGGRVTHPDVVVFDEAWNGYRYWMGFTPNMTGTSYYENPSIVASNDGINWEIPKGVKNPVQDRIDKPENEKEHNCDADLLYDKANDRLILYYEWARDAKDPACSEVRAVVSYNGSDWGIPNETNRTVSREGEKAYVTVLRTNEDSYSDLSPTVTYNPNKGLYEMWGNDSGPNGYNNGNYREWYLSSKNPLDFGKEGKKKSEQGRVYVNNFLGKDEDGNQMAAWHQDVQWIESKQEYWAIVQAFPANKNPDSTSLRMTTSKDGINWKPVVDAEGISRKLLAPSPTLNVPKDSNQHHFDDFQIYRTTFWYDGKNDKMHLWYSALDKREHYTDAGRLKGQNWSIAYTSADRKAMDRYAKNAEEKRIIVNNENPLLILPVYGDSYDSKTDTAVCSWGDTVLGRWKSLPDDLKKNAVIELHLGGRIGLKDKTGKDAKGYYEHQLEIAQKNNIPVMIVVSTAGLQSQYTGTAGLTPEWADEMFQKYSCLKGLMCTENYWTSYMDVARANIPYMKVAYKHGGIFVWSEHQEHVIEKIIANDDFRKALEAYGDNFIFTWKNTPTHANANAGSASYMQGLWLAGVIDQWGGLADTWKWYEKEFGKLFSENTGFINEKGKPSYINNDGQPGSEEARAVATEPEALLGIEMMSIYANGGCVYNFEHPAYVYGVYDKNTPLYENVIMEFMRYAVKNPAPSKEEVMKDTKVAFHGSLSAMKGNNMLQMDVNWADATLPTQTTGRYGLIPAVPSGISKDVVDQIFYGKTIVNQKTPELAKDKKKAFFDSKYPEMYQGTGFAQKVKDQWYIYNSNCNVNENQNVQFTLKDGSSIDITMEPHTYMILNDQKDRLEFTFNNYRVDKDEIWEKYGEKDGPNNLRWDTDHNKYFEEWIKSNYIKNTKDETLRVTAFKLSNVEKEPVIKVIKGLKDRYEAPVVVYDKVKKTADITLKCNGYVDFEITYGPGEEYEKAASQINTEIKTAEYLNVNDYDTASWAAYQNALKAGQEAIAKQDPKLAVEALNKIKAARGSLKLKNSVPAPIEPPSDPVDSVKKGDILTDAKSKAKYTVTNAAKGKVEVSFVEDTSNKTSLVIPATIKSNNVTCKVTSIEKNAFKNKKISKITIGKNIKKIGANAFYGCKNLKKVVVKSKSLTMKSVGKNAFKKTNKKISISVPKNKKALYKKIFVKRGMKL